MKWIMHQTLEIALWSYTVPISRLLLHNELFQYSDHFHLTTS
jgi:hypothetical protein